ncbi:hypothetical protein BDV11DRAFT_211877 [Aspergillus similis]
MELRSGDGSQKLGGCWSRALSAALQPEAMNAARSDSFCPKHNRPSTIVQQPLTNTVNHTQSPEIAVCNARNDISREATFGIKEATRNGEDKVAQEQPVKSARGNADTTGDEYITGVTLLMVIIWVKLVSLLMLLDTAIVSTANRQITNEFHSLRDVAWYRSAYTLASLLCGGANSSKMLIVGRAVAGIGTSGTINGAITIIAGAVSMQKRPALIGVMMGVPQLGLVLGPLIGGAFTTYTTWRWSTEGRAIDVLPTFFWTFDLLGFALFAPAAVMFLLVLEYGGQEYPWNSSTVIGLFCGAGATAVIFLLWEYRAGRDAMIPFHLICQRITYCSFIFVTTTFGLTIVVIFYTPIYFQAVMGDSALISGVNLLPIFFVSCKVFPAGKLGYYLPWAVFGSVLCAIGSGLLSAGYQALFGLGRGASTQPRIPQRHSTVTAMIFGQSFGGSVFLSVAQVIFSNCLRDTIPEYAPNVSVESIITVEHALS